MKALVHLAVAMALAWATQTQAADPVIALQAATSLTPSVALSSPAAPVTVSAEAMRGVQPIASIDHTAQSSDIWGRLRQGFAMRNLEGPLVDDRMNYYLARPGALKVMLERSRKYLYYIVGELEKRGMPTELALLPVVESAFNPLALSSAKAAGLWQFIPSTGKDFALTQNWWVDERRDIVASTDAALTYLQAIYEMHGDWQLALASYNWGENAVARAIANNKAAGKPTDFANLNMPTETRYYVPKLQAIKNIIARPELYNISLPAIPNEPYFTTVEKTQGMDVAVAAKLAEMTTPEFLMLNPGYNRPVIPGSHDAGIVLPIENAKKFQENLAAQLASSKPLTTWKTYAVPQTSRIEQIARKLGLAVQALCSANGLRARALLAAGYTLLIPSSASTSVSTSIPSGLSEPVPVKKSLQPVSSRVRNVGHKPRHTAAVRSAKRRR